MSISDENGLMTYNGRYLIAVGFYFDVQVGDYIDLVLENGEVIPCIVGDRKALIDTGEQGLFTSNGCMSEFIVATWNLPAEVKRTGNVSVLHNWNSPVTSVITYDKNVLNNES
jgi:hypothetical protein